MTHNDPNLDEAVNSLKSIKVGMTDASRRHLAILCRDGVQARRAGLSWLFGSVPTVRASLAAGLLGLTLVVGVALLTLERRSQPPALGIGGESHVSLVAVAPAGSGGITLEWKDGSQRVYTVLKSNNPRDFRGAEAHAVRGNRWTDAAPSTDQVVYYKVE